MRGGRTGPHAVIAEYLVDIARVATEQHQPHPQVEVFGLRHPGIESANRIKVYAAEGGTDVHAEAAIDHIGQTAMQAITSALLAFEAKPLGRNCAKDTRVAGSEADGRIAFEQRNHCPEVAWSKQVIAIEQRNQGRSARGDSAIARRRNSAVWRREKADPPIPKERRDSTRDIVGRAVVDHHAFPSSKGLSEQRIQGFAEKMRNAVSRHDHGHARRSERISNRSDLGHGFAIAPAC